MDGETASWIFYSGLLIYGLVLFAFKRLYLDTLESRVLSYMLGLVLAYGILAGVFLASRESMVVRTVLQEALWSGRTYTYQGAGFLLVIVPAVYSIFLLRFFEKGGKNAAWKEKVKMMGAVSINTVMALLGLLCFNYMLDGHSMEECRIVLEESFASIGWESGLLSIALMYFVFYIIKRDHFKHYDRRRK
ncbi:hypothetical protein [Dialister invisus]|uniref:hypothetical protein n=1 Tax=Dialister invisus TaxID=218538 RepID=UPI0023A7AD8E|nr:hypothetical protein [Dialister invisus]